MIGENMPRDGNRIAVIGAGHVGATAAYALMLRALFREIVLIDRNMALAGAEAADLSDASAMARPAHIWAGSYADAASAHIAVITAGATTHGTETRLSVAAKSAAIVTECVGGLMEAGFTGVIVVAANPVDLMALTAFRRSGLPASQVIGTGTLLDSSRLRQVLAERLDVAAISVEAQVLGEHGDSEVAAFSTARVGGLDLDRFTGGTDRPDKVQLGREVRDAVYAIVAGKGYTSFGVATAIVRICEAIVRDERSVLPVSTLASGQFGITDIYLSLPCIVGRDGIVDVLSPRLSPVEEQALLASAEVLRVASAGIRIAPG